MVQKSEIIFNREVMKLLEELRRTFPDEILEIKPATSRRVYIRITPHTHKEILKWIREKFPEESYLVSIDTVDYINENLFELNYLVQITNDKLKVTLVLKMNIPRENPVVETATHIIPGATLYERENHEMFGIIFKGHPYLTKLFLPEDWPEGVYPLRKDVKLIHKPKKW